MSRRSFLEIHEAEGSSHRRSVAGGRAGELHRSEPVQTWPDPSDPLETDPSPTGSGDSKKTLQEWPVLSNLQRDTRRGGGKRDWRAVATVQQAVCLPPAHGSTGGQEEGDRRVRAGAKRK